MENIQWLVMAMVAIVAVAATIYFGIQNLRNVITQRERDAGYASGRVEAKLENLEQLVRAVNEDVRAVKEDVRAVKEDVRGVKEDVRGVMADLRVVKEKLDVHDVLLRQLRREARKQSRHLRKLRKRVEALESPVPPTDPTSSEAHIEPASVPSRGPRLAVAGGGASVERGGAT